MESDTYAAKILHFLYDPPIFLRLEHLAPELHTLKYRFQWKEASVFVQFWKMNGTGNDFIVIDNQKACILPEQYAAIARTLCRRRLSIGADGLMVVERAHADGDFRMVFYNSDGSLGEMCGNGARCICRYGYETGLAGECQRVETTAGLVTGIRKDRSRYRIRLNNPALVDLCRPVTVDGVSYECAYVELGCPGVPHAVVPLSGLRDYPEEKLRLLGRSLRCHPAFPKGANVNFYELTGPDQFYERTYERGVEDFTYACGTGTASVAAVLTLQGKASGRNVCAAMTGGQLSIDADLDRGNGRILNLFLTGPTNVVAKGEVTDETLRL